MYDTPIEVWEKTRSEKITHEKIRDFITERMKTAGMRSPGWEKSYSGSGSRCVAPRRIQFVRPSDRISFAAASSSYVKLSRTSIAFVLPDSGRARASRRLSELVAKTSERYARSAQPDSRRRRALCAAQAAPKFHVMVEFRRDAAHLRPALAFARMGN